jgi:hypothetical protein
VSRTDDPHDITDELDLIDQLHIQNAEIAALKAIAERLAGALYEHVGECVYADFIVDECLGCNCYDDCALLAEYAKVKP